MASVTQNLSAGPFFTVTVTFDDTTGTISHLDWTVAQGTLTVTVHRQGQADLTRTVTSSGGVSVPAGYVMTLTPKGSWSWQGTIGFEMSWHS